MRSYAPKAENNLTKPLLSSSPSLRTQSPKSPEDPAKPLVEAEKLQTSFIDSLPFRNADTRLVQQWLSNWFGHHVDCPILDKPHAATLRKVTWTGKILRSYSKEMLFVDLIGWGFLIGDATPLVEDIDEARGYWNRICRIMKARFLHWLSGQFIFLGAQFLRAWWDRPLRVDLVIVLIEQWLALTVGLMLLFLMFDLVSSFLWRWVFWNRQWKHIEERQV